MSYIDDALDLLGIEEQKMPHYTNLVDPVGIEDPEASKLPSCSLLRN